MSDAEVARIHAAIAELPASFKDPLLLCAIGLAPYLGVFWERKLGGTADYARAEAEETSAISAVAGLRIWF